jgi:antitoxin (DNA-binding transcriptional repressor) of toxin-antitoxin stability system
MNVYTYTEARQKLATLLNRALQEGEVLIKRRDGQVFVLRPQPRADDSPLDVGGVNLNITATEIVNFIHEGRRTYETSQETT